MTLTFPLAASEFWDLLPMSSLDLDCEPQLESSGTGGGQQLTRELAPAMWRGTVALDKMTPAESIEALALLDFARQSGASFMAYDRLSPCPAMDPDGSVLGAVAPTVLAISADRRSFKITGLPAWYQIRRGDKVGLSWGASPLRYSLHRIAAASSADATGVTDWISVAPALHAAIAINAPVTLIRPPIRAMIVPRSARVGSLSRGLVTGTTFDFIQTNR